MARERGLTILSPKRGAALAQASQARHTAGLEVPWWRIGSCRTRCGLQGGSRCENTPSPQRLPWRNASLNFSWTAMIGRCGPDFWVGFARMLAFGGCEQEAHLPSACSLQQN
jgi:hypothetical protein